VFLLLALLLLLLLPEPWGAVAGLAGPLWPRGLYFYRRMRGVKVVTGVENLVGAAGKAVEPLEPEGHVRVHGELWEARAPEAVPAGAQIRVVALDGLTLEVETAEKTPVLPAQ
jgi:membrane-bound serine protease (ClpP class)